MKIEHAAAYVHDLEKVKSFFETYLGAKSNQRYHNPKTNFQSYFLTFSDGARLEIMTKPNLTDNNPSISQFGFSHLAFSLGSKEAVDELTEKLVSAGYDLISGPRITGDGYYESALVVVEGLQIELTL